jgi:hypothetical protein
MVNIVIVVALVVLVALHLYGAAFASWHLSKSQYFEPWQKFAQYAIIWLIPVLGTAFILNILGSEVRQRYPGWVPWLDFMLVSLFVSSATETIETSGSNEHTATTESTSTGGSDD